ncbi:MAG: 50S ribosomal protein L6 [Bacteroidota bacterium]
MSRIGKQPITIPSGVTVNVSKSNLVTIKGPKGELKQQIDPDMVIETEGAELTVKRPTDQKRHRAAHGLSRSLLANMVKGAADGYEVVMSVVGVGYKAEAKGQLLELALGYSHPIIMALPPEIKVETETKRGTPPKITLRSADKQLIGQIAAKIRGFRPPEPYKGKGIRFQGEQIRTKAGKAAGK